MECPCASTYRDVNFPYESQTRHAALSALRACVGAEAVGYPHVFKVQERVLEYEAREQTGATERNEAMKRRQHRGLRKLCDCAKAKWSTCKHSWYFNYKPRNVQRHNRESSDGGYRFSLDKQLGRHIDSKTEAEAEAARLRVAIDDGMFGQPERREDMTLRQLADAYLERYVTVNHADTQREYRYSLDMICRTAVARPTGGSAPLGHWRVTDIVTDSVNRFREVRLAAGGGKVGVNRNVLRLRALFNWAREQGYASHTPFIVNGVKARSIVLSDEQPRGRRLETGEEAALLAVCDPLLRALVVAAIDSGMRQGEILSLQWSQVEGMTVKDEKVTWATASRLFLPAAKTKTSKDRKVPISTRLRALLEMRRFDPKGQPCAVHAYVFGNEVGEQLSGFRRAWHTAILKSHGHEPEYTPTKNLTPKSRAALRAVNLHFHDLRREAGSRWLDGGVPIHTVRDWLGHTNVAQTSTYLAGTQSSEHEAMRRYEERLAELQRIATDAGKPRHRRTQSAASREKTLSKDAGELETAIM